MGAGVRGGGKRGVGGDSAVNSEKAIIWHAFKSSLTIGQFVECKHVEIPFANC